MKKAQKWNVERLKTGITDLRPFAVFAIASAVLAWQEYYGRSDFYQENIYPLLCQLDRTFPEWVQLSKYEALYGHVWWELVMTLGYVVFPFAIWKILFPKDALLDFGLTYARLLAAYATLWPFSRAHYHWRSVC